MDSLIAKELDSMLKHWELMSGSDYDDAEEDAARFQESFYRFMDIIRDWIESLSKRPKTVEEALQLPELAHITANLPAPLYLNFETELELILEGQSRILDPFED
ncbi:hypothetical protein [Paenibacillus senegalensis]|uniref:hypothetical protein n=1 Tax=Paenibacillus senegalensis TaxID=1465766 RepID=UPI0002890B9B|nr:hypothetical protein [Paenibacillus senegalensis]